jgi:nucleotide-binding universal stress UspA family protein
MRIMLATDGSPASLRAADFAAVLAQRAGQALGVLYVVWASGEAPATGETPAGNAGDDVEAVLYATQHRLDAYGVRATRLVRRGGDEGRVIAATAEEQGATLVVLGTHGRSGLRDRLLGSVSQDVVRHATCPVALVHPNATVDHEALGRLVLGSDGSPAALAAARATVPLAQALRAEVIVSHVAWLGIAGSGSLIPPEGIADIAPTQLLAVNGLHEALDGPAALLRAAGVPTRTYARNERRVAEGLDHAAQSLEAGLIVVGSRRLGDLAGRLLGSVAADLLAHATRPVLVVRTRGEPAR